MPAADQGDFLTGMKKVFASISELTLLPDADLEFATQMEDIVRSYLVERAQSMAGPGASPGGVPGIGGGSPPSPSPGPPDGRPSGLGGGGMGLVPNPQPVGGGMGGGAGGAGPSQPPNPDELRRILGATGQVQ